jgi:hypothetical protein
VGMREEVDEIEAKERKETVNSFIHMLFLDIVHEMNHHMLMFIFF